MCAACEGSGRVAPSPFFGDVVAWPAHLRKVAGLAEAGCPPGGSATAAGLLKPLPCPACGGAADGPAPGPLFALRAG